MATPEVDPNTGPSAARARFFREQGFLRIPSLLQPDEVNSLLTVIDPLFNDDLEAIQSIQTATPRKNKVYGVLDTTPLIADLAKHPIIVGHLQSILGPNIVALKNRHNHVSHNQSGDQPRFHRDVLQLSRSIVSAVVYLDEATVDNGCTLLVPGSHRFDYVGVPQPDGGGTWMDEHSEFEPFSDQAVPVPMPAGGALLFDGCLFHSPGLNKLATPRRSIALGYRAVDELQSTPDFEREMLVAGSYLYRGNDAQ